MEKYENIIITESNYYKYEGDLITLYSSIFEKPPYNEKWGKDDLKRLFQKHLIYKDNLIILKVIHEDNRVVAFCVGCSAYCAEEELQPVCEKMDIDLKNCYYIAELGTLDDDRFRRKGFATDLLNHLIHLNTDRYSHFIVRTTEKNEVSLSLYEKFYFKKIDQVRYSIKKKRINGKEGVDDRIFLYLDLTVKKIGYRILLRLAKVKECGEKLVTANHFDQEILLEKATIGLFPYGNGGDYAKVRESVAEKLKNINEKLKKVHPDYRLNVCYGFRSKDIQKSAFCEQRRKMGEKRMPFDSISHFVEEVHRFIAVPTVAGHPTGGAVDITIKDIKNNQFLDMGSLIYEFSSDKIRWNAKGLTLEQKINRRLLYNLMTAEGFAPFWGEWWHYSYGEKEWAVYYNKESAIYEQIETVKVIIFIEASGNPTALVLSDHPFETHKDIGRKLIEMLQDKDRSTSVEQVAFLLEKKDKFVKFRMAGGEMCVNALIALGAYAGEMEDGHASIEILLGCETSNLHLEKYTSWSEKGTTKIDLIPEFRFKERVEKQGISTIIHFDGISHAVIPVDAFDEKKDEDIKPFLEEYRLLDKPASGILFVHDEGDKINLNPFVYVRDLKTLINETACGSGSIAAGVWKVLKENRDIIDFPVIQRTEKPIFLTIRRNANTLSASIATEVLLIDERVVNMQL